MYSISFDEIFDKMIGNKKEVVIKRKNKAEDLDTGNGKPERLKHFKDRAIYSRRITDEHRLVYDMKDDRVRILGCKGHYKENYDK